MRSDLTDYEVPRWAVAAEQAAWRAACGRQQHLNTRCRLRKNCYSNFADSVGLVVWGHPRTKGTVPAMN